MKKQAYIALAMIVLVGLIAIEAKAQTSGRTRLVANIPFEFNVGEKTMPAGDYTVVQINPASDPVVLRLRSSDGKSSTMIRMNSLIGKAQDNARLVFRRYGNKYFFAEAWVDGDANGLGVPKSRAELAATRTFGVPAKTETVALRARANHK